MPRILGINLIRIFLQAGLIVYLLSLLSVVLSAAGLRIIQSKGVFDSVSIFNNNNKVS